MISYRDGKWFKSQGKRRHSRVFRWGDWVYCGPVINRLISMDNGSGIHPMASWGKGEWVTLDHSRYPAALIADAQIKVADMARMAYSGDIEFRMFHKIPSPLAHRALTWASVCRLDLWWCGQHLLLPFSCTVAPFSCDGHGLLTLHRCPWWPGTAGAKEKSTLFEWVYLQWQMHLIPVSISCWGVFQIINC